MPRFPDEGASPVAKALLIVFGIIAGSYLILVVLSFMAGFLYDTGIVGIIIIVVSLIILMYILSKIFRKKSSVMGTEAVE